MDIKRLFDFPYHQLETHNLEAALVSKKMESGLKPLPQSTLIKPMLLAVPY
jgi:hypothetical protein